MKFIRLEISMVVTAIMIAVTNILPAQNYSITPDDTIIGWVPYNDIYHFNFLQNNLTTGSLIFSYEKVDVVYPIGWTANLCDNGTCFEGFPNSGTMDTVFNGDVGLMSVGINPGVIPGSSLVQYAIWEVSTPEIVDTLTWIVTAGEPTIIDEISSIFDFIFNPQIHSLLISSNINDGFEYFVCDLTGRALIKGKSFQSEVSIDVASFKTGIYFIYILKWQTIVKGKQLFINN